MNIENCFSVCAGCGKEIVCNYTHKNQKLYCTSCNKEIFSYIIVYE